jgi:hypothetical protein
VLNACAKTIEKDEALRPFGLKSEAAVWAIHQMEKYGAAARYYLQLKTYYLIELNLQSIKRPIAL